MINEQLKEFGLSDKESKVYLTLLQLGSAPVQEIAATAKLNRSTTYVVLDSLEKHELITISEKSSGRVYTAISPELLIQKTGNLINKYSKIEKDIEAIIPDLNAFSKSLKRRPRVLFFEGLEGIKSVFEDVLSSKPGTLLRSFGDPIAWQKVQPNYFENVSKKRLARGIVTKAIQPTPNKTKTDKNISVHDPEKISKENETIHIPSDKHNFTSDLSIYDNKVVLISPQDEYGVIIENADIAQTMTELFDLAWEEAKRISE